MPPPRAQEALAAAERTAALGWLDLPAAVVDAASEAWIVAFLALALFAWLEREVKDVVKVFLPLAAALAAATGLALLAPALGLVPRPLAEAGRGVGALLGHAFPGGQAAAVAAFATYALLAYGRRARAALLLAAAVATGRAVTGAPWAADVAGGGLAGAALGSLAYAAALRLAPRGHLARLRAARRPPTARLAAPPSA